MKNIKLIMEEWRKFVNEEADPNKIDPKLFPTRLRAVDPQMAQALAYTGQKDQNPKDDVLQVKEKAAFPANTILPGQTTMDLGKFVGMGIQMMLKVGGFSNGAGGDLGAIISSDKHIMDGHHRWAGTILADPTASVSGLQIGIPGQKLLGVLNVWTKAHGGQGKTSTHNLKDLNGAVVKQEILKQLQQGMKGFLTAEQLQAALQKTGMTAEQLANKAVQNWETVKPYSKIQPWMPPKIDMPAIEPAQLPTVVNDIKGIMDLNPPYSPVTQQVFASKGVKGRAAAQNQAAGQQLKEGRFRLGSKGNVNEEAALDPKAAKQLDTIIKEPYMNFVSDLKKVVKDPRVQAVLKHGLNDEDPNDEKVKVDKKQPYVYKLRPTQNEIDMDGSLKWAVKSLDSFNNLLKPGAKLLGSPIVTGADGTLVLDGHHRWSQVYCVNPEAQMEAVDLTIDGAQPMTYLKVMQLGIAADIQDVPVQTVKGQNLLDQSITEQMISQYLLKKAGRDLLKEAGTPGSVLQNTIKQKLGNKTNQKAAKQVAQQPQQPVQESRNFHKLNEADMEYSFLKSGAALLGKYIFSNILKMRQTSQAVSGAPARSYMPQTDDAKNWKDKVTSGELNFKNTAAVATGTPQNQQTQKPVNEGRFRITKKRG